MSEASDDALGTQDLFGGQLPHTWQPEEKYAPQMAFFPLEPIIQLYVTANREWVQKTYRGRRGGLFRASSFVNCPRVVMLERAGIEELRVMDDKTERTFAWGDLIQRFVSEMFRDLGILIDEEVELKDDELQVAAHADLVVGGVVQPVPLGDETDFISHVRTLLVQRFGDTLPTLGVEVKSANSRAMKYIYEGGPKRHNMLQAACQKLLARRTGIPIFDYWQLLYIGKDWGGTHEFDISEDWEKAAERRLVELREVWESGAYPPCTCGKSLDSTDGEWKPDDREKWTINYCGFKDPLEEGCCSDDLEEQYLAARKEQG